MGKPSKMPLLRPSVEDMRCLWKLEIKGCVGIYIYIYINVKVGGYLDEKIVNHYMSLASSPGIIKAKVL